MILDLSMGWQFQWDRLDSITKTYQPALFAPIILRCPKAVCFDRLARRYADHPNLYDPPEMYSSDPKLLRVWDYLQRLHRADVYFVDATESPEHIHEEAMQYLQDRLAILT